MIKVLFICHGNICRSTMAQSLLEHIVKERKLDGLFEIDSAATSREEIGSPPHRGTVRALSSRGIPVIQHRARQMTLDDYYRFDYLIGMDEYNMRNMHRISGEKDKIYKLLDFVHDDSSYCGRDVADPWYTGDFDRTFDDIYKGLISFLDFLEINK